MVEANAANSVGEGEELAQDLDNLNVNEPSTGEAPQTNEEDEEIKGEPE